MILICFFFFFNDSATPEIYTLSLHDALPIWWRPGQCQVLSPARFDLRELLTLPRDRKSTRLNSSHANISYAVFCLKKKNNEWLLHGAVESDREHRVFIALHPDSTEHGHRAVP